MTYLLDTDTIVYAINKRHLDLVKKIEKTALRTTVLLSSITYAELYYGLEKSAKREENRQNLMQFLSAYDVVDFNRSAAEYYGKIKADLFRKGTPIGGNDLLIAGHALALDATLVTNNVAEFSRVPGLVTENWI